MAQVTITCTCGNELASDAEDGLEWYDNSVRCDCGAWYICSVTQLDTQKH